MKIKNLSLIAAISACMLSPVLVQAGTYEQAVIDATASIDNAKKLNYEWRDSRKILKKAEKLNKEVDAKLERNSKLKVYVIDDGTGREYGGAYKSKEQFILDVREKTRFSKSFIRTRMTESSNENVKSITQKHPNSLIPVTFECK